MVVTTSRLLSTGVDVETCKNVVIARPVGSFVEFKQILGRGTRLREPLKTWFTLIDYAGSIQHFFDPKFDGEPAAVRVEVLKPQPQVEGTNGEDEDETVPLTVAVLSSEENPELVANLVERAAQTTEDPIENGMGNTAENTPQIPTLDAAPDTGLQGLAATVEVEQTPLQVLVAGETAPHLPPQTPVQVLAGRRYAVAGEWIYELAPDGATLRTQRYSDFAREALQSEIADEATLRERWLHRQSREEMLAILGDEGVQLSSLAASLETPGADRLDLLAHVLFDAPLRTRDERAQTFLARHEAFLSSFSPPARATLEALLEKYRAGDADDLRDTEHLKMLPGTNLPKTLAMVEAFGGGDKMRTALAQMEERLYRD